MADIPPADLTRSADRYNDATRQHHPDCSYWAEQRSADCDCGTVRKAAGSMEVVGPLPNGCTLYREPNEVGGHRYWSDEVGGGVGVWDTCLVDSSTLLAALVAEEQRIREAMRGKR